ncbi:MAG TPA: hypothetical protein PLX61_01020, partial [Bacteroidales bacterium]|nr:hypothetical protein [Bacteroidales bacterium]
NRADFQTKYWVPMLRNNHTTHTLFNIKKNQHIDRLFAGILNTPVGMKNHVPAKRPAPIGHSDGRYHGVGCRHSIAHRTSYDFSVKRSNTQVR